MKEKNTLRAASALQEIIRLMREIRKPIKLKDSVPIWRRQ